jgi:hypothetical protein
MEHARAIPARSHLRNRKSVDFINELLDAVAMCTGVGTVEGCRAVRPARVAGSDATVGEVAVDADAGDAQEQVAHLGAGRVCGWGRPDTGEVDAPVGDVVFELGAGDAVTAGVAAQMRDTTPAYERR